ncbi:tripartite motif-containing protein 55-like [Saccostrea echinata]|uniref:tripartite motif-containing protein 55-like n=1 Tax=Saccostrea echinata TaxID=191078 RepID=UPI002A7FA88E|nr:tripartite motif-containing protein 55-like [Saccostrea echinata]
MDLQGLRICKVRQCSQCQGDTEFYCKTCKHGLCLQCKEKHVIDLDTIYHDVVIYREKYENLTKQETCERHQNMIYEKYCHSCELPVCAQCTKHRNPQKFPFFLQWMKYRKHKILDLRTAYETNRQQNREIIHNIRSETLYNSCFLLSRIQTDVKACQTEISNRESEMSAKSQKLKDLIDTVICDVKIRHKSLMIQRLQEQIRKMNGHLASIENFEYRSEQSANRPVKFLFFLKNTKVPMIKILLILHNMPLSLLQRKSTSRM